MYLTRRGLATVVGIEMFRIVADGRDCGAKVGVESRHRSLQSAFLRNTHEAAKMGRMAVQRLPDEVRCVHIMDGSRRRCYSRKSEDGGDLCPIHKRRAELELERWRLAQDLPDVQPVDALRELLRMDRATLMKLELAMHDMQLVDWFSVTERETRQGGPGGGFDLKRKLLTDHPIYAAWVKERDLSARHLHMALGYGLAEREQKLHEAEIGMVLQVLMTFAANAGLDAESMEIRQLMIAALRAVSGERDVIELGR